MSSRQQRRAAARAAAKQARRAEVNRQNAQHSTGPCTEEGKARSSRNSFKHGLYSQQLCTSLEQVAALDALKADLRAEHQPVNQTEEILVNELAEQHWSIMRARRLETQVLEDPNSTIAQLAAIQRMMSAAERGFHKALNTLRQLQAERGFVPQIAQESETKEESDGFVSQNADASQAHADAPGFVSQDELEFHLPGPLSPVRVSPVTATNHHLDPAPPSVKIGA